MVVAHRLVPNKMVLENESPLVAQAQFSCKLVLRVNVKSYHVDVCLLGAESLDFDESLFRSYFNFRDLIHRWRQ